MDLPGLLSFQFIQCFRHLYRISTAGQEAIVGERLGRVLGEKDGGFGLPASSIRVKIWWETGSKEDGLAER